MAKVKWALRVPCELWIYWTKRANGVLLWGRPVGGLGIVGWGNLGSWTKAGLEMRGVGLHDVLTPPSSEVLASRQ